MDHHHKPTAHKTGDWREAGQCVVTQVFVERGRKQVRGRHDHQGVTVRLGHGRLSGAQGRASAWAVIHHHRLFERKRQLVGEGTRQHVGGATRCERNNDLDGLRGPGAALGKGQATGSCNSANQH